MQSLMRNIGSLALLLLSLSLVVLPACSDDGDGDIAGGDSGRLLVTPLSVTFPRIQLGETASQEITIQNTHETESLTLLDVQMSAREGGSADDLVLKDKPKTDFVLGAGEQTTMSVEFTSSGTANEAVIEIVNTDPRFTRDEPFSLDVDTLANSPQIDVSPSSINFHRRAPGESATETVTVRNYGSAPLVIHEAAYSGGNDFAIDDLPDGEIILEPSDGLVTDENRDSYELDLVVRYSPRDEGGDRGEIRIESNDTRGDSTQDGRGITTIDVQANAVGPCIRVEGGLTQNFGPVPIGATSTEGVRVNNCGTEMLSISGIEMLENSGDDEFDLDLDSLDVDNDGQLDQPLRLEPEESETFQIEYGPIQVGSDSGKVLISSNATAQPELRLVGRGTDGECPVAKIAASVRGVSTSPRPTVSAAPLDYVILDGSSSADPDGRVIEYMWEAIELPDGLPDDVLGPTAEDSDDTDMSKREFRALLAGTYKFGLEVKDNEGYVSCDQAVATIVATPNEKLHIELTWTNPEDPDESDDRGSDVDVHLVKMGPGNWFDATYDIYFNNPNSGAGGGTGLWNPESPSLDIDDTDGAGPENIQMDDPSDCEWYAVGVHYYSQIYGTAYVTLRIYINEDMVYEQINIPLQTGGQFWDVARIHWNQGQATIEDVNQVMPISPNGDPPTVPEAMANSGLCTSQALY